ARHPGRRAGEGGSRRRPPDRPQLRGGARRPLLHPRQPQGAPVHPGRRHAEGVRRRAGDRLRRVRQARRRRHRGLGFAGPDTADNPTAGVVFVVFWIGLLPLSLALGPVWRWLNPLRTLHLLACAVVRRDPRRGIARLPRGVGYWPAAGGLLAFT